MINFGICWLHRCTNTREATVDRSQVFHSFQENAVSSSSHFRESAGELAALFSNFPTETAFPQDIKRFNENVSNPEETVKLALEQQRDHQLAEGKSENLEARM